MKSGTIQVMMTVALVSSLTSDSPTKFLLSQDNPYDVSYYPRQGYGPGYLPFHIPPGANAKYTLSDDFVETRAGVIDVLFLTQLITRMNKLEEAINNLNANSQATLDQLSIIESDQSTLKATVAGLSEPTSIGAMPTSCLELQELGNIKSGLYNIKSSTKVAAVYCDFTKDPSDADFQQTIGSLNVQTAPVYFYVLRTTDLADSQANIPFEIETLNVGGAMDITTGTFTAPVDGTYFFSFSGTVTTPEVQSGSELPGSFEVVLQLNGDLVKKTVIRGSSVTHPLSHAMHLEATLDLKKDDQIWLSSSTTDPTSLLDGASSNSFTGMLLSEENFPAK